MNSSCGYDLLFNSRNYKEPVCHVAGFIKLIELCDDCDIGIIPLRYAPQVI